MIEELLARTTFPAPDTPVTCAVSGGPDSLALLVLACAAECSVTAVHVDHGLRDGSDKEADVVAAAAERFGAAFRAERVEVRPGPNLEARAREARYAVLPDDVLTGHTLDDQAETVLINLMRGASIDGLAGMRHDRRPLLALRRSDTEALCCHLELEPVRDPTNTDPTFLRNSVRAEVLPLLNRLADRDLAPIIVRQASLARDDAELLDELAAAVDPTDAAALRDAPLPLARRAVRRWLRDEDGYPPDAATVERVLDVAAGRARGTEVGSGRRVDRRAGRLILD